MSQDLPCVSYMALYIISVHIVNSNSKTSTHWKLNTDIGKVQSAAVADGSLIDGDPLMSILTSKVTTEDGQWTLLGSNDCDANTLDSECNNDDSHQFNKPKAENTRKENSMKNGQANSNSNKTTVDVNKPTNVKSKNISTKERKPVSKNILDCGEVINNTKYDHLRGIMDRNIHPHVPEPEVAMIFRKKNSRPGNVDMNELERKLKKDKKERPKSELVYNQIGNFWRIKGNTQLSIACFRKALSLSPNNPDVLLNLARVLFNLQYLDDAIFLTRRSLEMQGSDQNTWLQHFTLGEILKEYGHFHEASLHFRHTLDLNPGFEPAEAHLREMEMSPDTTVTYYTLFIILFLVLGVLCGILTSMDGMFEEISESSKTQRHFNRAMAMRSIKLGIKPNLIRMRKQMSQ